MSNANFTAPSEVWHSAGSGSEGPLVAVLPPVPAPAVVSNDDVAALALADDDDDDADDDADDDDGCTVGEAGLLSKPGMGCDEYSNRPDLNNWR